MSSRSLSKEQEKLNKQRLATGEFASGGDVLDKPLTLLKWRGRELNAKHQASY
jgi:hypothetical protein